MELLKHDTGCKQGTAALGRFQKKVVNQHTWEIGCGVQNAKVVPREGEKERLRLFCFKRGYATIIL